MGAAFLAGTFALGDTLRHSYASAFTDAQRGSGGVVENRMTLSATFGLPPRAGLIDGGLAIRRARRAARLDVLTSVAAQ
jgi:hypothetical protein